MESRISLSPICADWEAFSQRICRSGSPSLSQGIRDEARRFLRRILGPFPGWLEIKGRNGPGAVAEQVTGRAKWVFHIRPPVPALFLRTNVTHLVEQGPGKVIAHGISRALAVPKDARGPRIICAEPLAHQHCQQALRLALEERIRKQLINSRVRVNLWDTERHKRQAVSPGYATLDLKDASDLLSRRLVKLLFPDDWGAALFSVRSHFVRIPSGRIIPCRAFATMGNATTFPVESLVFAALVYAATERRASVFGDDIVVHNEDVPRVYDALESAGLRVNLTKTCAFFSPLRETCGSFWYEGNPFFPVRLRRGPEGNGWLHCLEIAMFFGAKQWTASAVALVNLATQYLRERRPWILKRIQKPPTRWNSGLQRREVLLPQIGAAQLKKLDGYVGLYAYFSQGSSLVAAHVIDRVVWRWSEFSLLSQHPISALAFIREDSCA